MLDRLAAALSDRYDVERELGRGGMATVWLAKDRRHDRLVAIKVLHPELAGAIGSDRFLREVRLTARLQHPSVVPVLDSGVLPANGDVALPWYAMAYVEGTSLRSRLARDVQLPVDEAIGIARDVSAALAVAHAQGIVHRDIKPENILLADGRVYVVDFGIAKALLATDADRLTSTGLAVGTPAYMSPEQATLAPVDARTDQYSLAAVLYEMLAGEPPVTGPNAQAILARRLAEPVRPIRPVRPTVPEAIDRAILRALERVPADRFPDVSAFSAALQSTTTNSSTVAPSSDGRRRLRRSLVAAGAVAIVALAAWPAVAHRGVRPADAARHAQRDTLYRRGIRGYEQRTTAGLIDGILSFKASVALDSNFAAGWAGLAKAYVRVVERQYQIPGVQPDSLLRLAVAALDRAIALDPTDAEVWVGRAAVLRRVDATEVAASMRAARKAIALDSLNGQAWHFLAMGLAEEGLLDSALKVWREEVRHSPKYTYGLFFLGQGLFWHRQYDSAAVWTDSALAIEPTFVTAKELAGLIEVERGNFTRAIADFEATRRLGTDVDAASALMDRGMAEARMGRRREARATLQVADSMARRFAPPPLHPTVAMARAYAALGDAAGAVAWLKRYPEQRDLHFLLHVRCDAPFVAIARDPRYREILAAGPLGASC